MLQDMKKHFVRPTNDMEEVIEKYGDTLYRICIVLLGNIYDAEEMVQETFITYMTENKNFVEEEYKKAWLIKVAQNKSKNMIRYKKRHRCIDISEMNELYQDSAEYKLLEDVLHLEYKYKTVLHLHYYEGYSIEEISKILHIKPNAVKKRLQRGREQFRLLKLMKYKSKEIGHFLLQQIELNLFLIR